MTLPSLQTTVTTLHFQTDKTTTGLTPTADTREKLKPCETGGEAVGGAFHTIPFDSVQAPCTTVNVWLLETFYNLKKLVLNSTDGAEAQPTSTESRLHLLLGIYFVF